MGLAEVSSPHPEAKAANVGSKPLQGRLSDEDRSARSHRGLKTPFVVAGWLATRPLVQRGFAP